MSEFSPQFPNEATRTLVWRVLSKYPDTQDDDWLLYVKVLIELKGERYPMEMIHVLFTDMDNGTIPSMDTVTRQRRFVQQHDIGLRGNRWLERHRKERETVEALRELQNRKERWNVEPLREFRF